MVTFSLLNLVAAVPFWVTSLPKHIRIYSMVILILISVMLIYGNRIYRVLVFASVALPGYIAYTLESKKSKPNYEPLHRKYAPKTAAVVSRLEGIYYKVAQIFGARGDVSPPIYQNNLKKFLDKVTPKPWNIIKTNFDRKLKVEPKALAAASIGQIHRGEYQGIPVVVKILYPGIERQTKTDLWALKLWCKHALPGIKPQIDSFSDAILTEFDLRKEAEVQTIQRHHFIKNTTFNVVIPKIIGTPKRTSIMMEYINGTPLLEYLRLHPDEVEKWITLVFKVCIEQILEVGVYSTDPHPGNFLVFEGKLVVLDFGQHSYLTIEKRRLLKELWNLLAEPTGSKSIEIANKLMDMGFKTKHSKVEFLNYFATGLFDTQVVNPKEISIGDFNQSMAEDEMLETPSDLTMVSKVIVTLRGLSSLFNLHHYSVAKLQKM